MENLVKAGVHRRGTVELAKIVETAKANENFHKAGAIAVFIGVVRGEDKDRGKVTKLELTAFEEKANNALKKICNDLNKREGIVDVQIHHLLGEFEVGEELVYVLVAGTHRKQAFSVAQEAVERYKKEVPVFKKEYIIDEGKAKSYWVAERETWG